MRVRVLVATVDAQTGETRKSLFRGDEHDLPDDEAARLIAAGAVESVGSPALREIPAPPADKMVRQRKTKAGGGPA